MTATNTKLSRRALLTGALATAAAVTLPATKYACGGFIPPIPDAMMPIWAIDDWSGPFKYFLNQAQWDFFKRLGCDMTRDDLVLIRPIPEC